MAKETKLQGFDLVIDEALSKIGSLTRDQLAWVMHLLEDKIKNPLEVSVTGSDGVISLASSIQQLLKSDGDGTYSDSFRRNIQPIAGQILDIAASTIDVQTGNVTGDFNSPPNSKSMTASYFVYMGIEVRGDGKLYVAFGDEAASAGAATYPVFSSGSAQPLLYVLLEDDGSGGEWNFNNVLDSNITILAGGGGGGASGTSQGADLAMIQYWVRAFDDFSDGDLADASYTTAILDGGNKKYDMEYDASKNITKNGANNLTISGAPAFTVAVGDIIQNIDGTKHTRITTVTSQTDVDVEDDSVLTDGQVLISQVYQIQEHTNYGSDPNRVIDQYPGIAGELFNEVLCTYLDSAVEKLSVDPDISFSVCSNATFNTPDNWSATHTRASSLMEENSPVVVPNAGNLMRVRFFANKTSGSGTVSLEEFNLYYGDRESNSSHAPKWVIGYYDLGTATWTDDGSDSGFSFSNETSPDRLRVNLGFIVDRLRAANAAKCQLTVKINGQEIALGNSPIVTWDYHYLFVDDNTIDIYPNPITGATKDQEVLCYVIDAGSVDVSHVANRFSEDGVYFDEDQEAHIRFNTTTNVFEGRKDSTSNYIPLGSGGAGEAGDTLQDAELGLPYEDSQNMILDTFNTDLGTKVKMVNMGSALRFDPAETTGASYTRSRMTSPVISSVDGRMVADVQMFKPQATVITGNDIVFDGDVTSYFIDTYHVLIGRVEDSDGRKIIRHLLDTDDEPAYLAINGSPTYDSGNDETTLTLSNPNSLDLNAGLTVAADVEEKLRIMPFEWSVSACSDDASTWELMNIVEGMLYEQGIIGIPGEGFFSDAENPLTGTTFKSDTVFSQNKQYGFRRFEENDATYDLFVYEYSIDRGKTWSYFGGSKGNSSIARGSSGTGSNEEGGQFHRLNRGQICVANNGKFFECHPYYGGTYFEIHGRYGDLTIPTPVLNLTPTTGDGAGIVYKWGSGSAYGQAAADPIDGSFAVVLAKISNYTYDLRSFNNYGATYLGSAASANTRYYDRYHLLEVSGSGTSHVVHHAATYEQTPWAIYMDYVQESAPTTVTSNGSNGIESGIIDSCVCDDYVLMLIRYVTSETLRFMYKDITGGGTGAWSSTKLLNANLSDSIDLYQGWSASAMINMQKGIHQKIVVDPSDNEHVFFTQEFVEDTPRSILFEIKDITDHSGLLDYQTTGVNNVSLGSSSYPRRGQSFLASSSHLETVIVKLYNGNSGVFAAGTKIKMKLWNATSATSGPTTEVIDSQTEFDISEISSAAWQRLRFNFPRSLSLTPSNYYFIDIYTTNTSSSGSLYMHNNNANAYANGQAAYHDGAVWQQHAGNDWVFSLHDCRVTDIGEAREATASPVNDNIRNYESSIVLLNNTNIQYITRKCFNAGGGAVNPLMGHPWRKIIPFTAGGSVECDTTGELVPVSLNNVFDPYLVFNVSLGNPDCKIKDLITGADGGSTYYRNHRVGIPIDIYGVNNPTHTVDSNFESEACFTFNGSSNYIGYGQSALDISVWKLLLKDFIMEMEIHPVSVTSPAQPLMLSAYSSAGNGWHWGYDPSGYMKFLVYGAGQGTVASDKVEPLTYHKVRVTRTNGIIKLWRAENPVDNYTIFTEVSSYSDNSANNVSCGAEAATSWTVGKHNTLAGNYWNGKIGYAKVAIGIDTFEYNGFKDQSAIVSLQNHGHLISGENIIGDTDDTITNNFDVPVLSDGQESALVDSYRQQFKYKNASFANQGQNCKLKIEADRGTTDDQTNVQGLLFEYKKQ